MDRAVEHVERLHYTEIRLLFFFFCDFSKVAFIVIYNILYDDTADFFLGCNVFNIIHMTCPLLLLCLGIAV